MGRKRIDILIPQSPFTTRDLKQQNPCVSAFVIQRNLEEWVARGRVRRIGSVPSTGRSKAYYQYEAVQADSIPGTPLRPIAATIRLFTPPAAR